MSRKSRASAIQRKNHSTPLKQHEKYEQITYNEAPSSNAMTLYKQPMPSRHSNDPTSTGDNIKHKYICVNTDPFSRMRVIERDANGNEKHVEFTGDITECTRRNADGSSITFKASTHRH